MADIQVWEVTEPYLDLHCDLGEGPFYEEETHSLRFVDIISHRIHTVDLAAGPSSLHTLQLDTPVGVTADIEGVDARETLAVGLKYGLAILDRKTGKYEYVYKFADSAKPQSVVTTTDFERTRANDGAADPHGRFWLGFMTDFNLGAFQPEGGLALFGPSSKNDLFKAGLTIPNALGFSPDNRTLYFTHTTANKVYAYDYDLATGATTNERVVYTHTGPGAPDGFRVDVEGNLWHAFYGGGCVLKIDPATGSVLGKVVLPTNNITCTQFVGTELFITSAKDDAAEGGEQSKALGGAVFKVDVGVKGLPLFKYKQ